MRWAPCFGAQGCPQHHRRAPVYPTGSEDVDSRTIANSRNPRAKANRSALCPRRGDARKMPDPTIGRAGYAKTCARDSGVMRPRIVLKWVEQPAQFGEQFFNTRPQAHRADVPPRARTRLPHRERCVREPPPRRPRRRRGFLRSNLGRDLAIGVGGQDHAIPLALVHVAKPRQCPSPRDERCQRVRPMEAIALQRRGPQATDRRPAFVRGCGSRSAQLFANTTTRMSVGAIGWPQSVALPGKSAQAGRQALFFILTGYGDNETWSSGRGRDKR